MDGMYGSGGGGDGDALHRAWNKADWVCRFMGAAKVLGDEGAGIGGAGKEAEKDS